LDLLFCQKLQQGGLYNQPQPGRIVDFDRYRRGRFTTGIAGGVTPDNDGKVK
jgi:hypothetical protein